MISLSRALDVSTSALASHLRGWAGTTAFRPAKSQPVQPIILYEMENCPYCRLVRETLTTLDLDAEIRPCPKGGTRFRPEAQSLSGRAQFPLMVDPNTGRQLLESADIVDYLHATYGEGGKTARGLLRRLRVASSYSATAMRPARGYRARSSRAPEKPLELYSFESSPYCRIVREALCELELPYTLRGGGRASLKDIGTPATRKLFTPGRQPVGRNRVALAARAGRVQFPYLVDPNVLGSDGQATALFESTEIVAYLNRTYGASHGLA